VDQMKEATRAASCLAKENRQLKPQVQSLRATVTEGHQRDLARSQEIEGKCFYPSISCIPKPAPDPLQ
jgi:hypothetical protein